MLSIAAVVQGGIEIDELSIFLFVEASALPPGSAVTIGAPRARIDVIESNFVFIV